jgi:hypothetical protein
VGGAGGIREGWRVWVRGAGGLGERELEGLGVCEGWRVWGGGKEAGGFGGGGKLGCFFSLPPKHVQ